MSRRCRVQVRTAQVEADVHFSPDAEEGACWMVHFLGRPGQFEPSSYQQNQLFASLDDALAFIAEIIVRMEVHS